MSTRAKAQQSVENSSLQTTHNTTVDVLRIVFAIGVVAIHTVPFRDTLWVYLLRLTALAVPYFATISGFYFNVNYEKYGRKHVFQYCKRLILVYFGWCTFLYSIQIDAQLRNEGYLYMNWRNWLVDHVSLGHLWYIFALLAAVLIFYLFSRVGMQKVLMGLSVLLFLLYQMSTSYYKLFDANAVVNFINKPELHLLKNVFFQVLPFFVMGTVVHKYRDKLLSIKSKTSLVMLGGAFALYVVEFLLTLKMGWGVSICSVSVPFYPVLALVLYALKNPTIFSADYRHARYCRKLSAFTYYIHPFFINFIAKIALFDSCNSTEKFLLVLVASVGAGSIIYLFNNKYTNHVFD